MSIEKNRQFSDKAGRWMVSLAWIGFAGMLTWLFGDLLDQQRNPNQQVVTRLENQTREVELLRNRSGHYVASGEINGLAVEFMLDTGATQVVIPEGIARQLGLQRGPVVQAATANGIIETFATRLRTVAIGEIQLHNVSASINPYMPGEQILLGMSFLKNLDLLQQGDRLTIRQNIR